MSLTLAQIANDSKALNTLVKGTIASYTKVATALHNTACAVFFHVAQGNDPKPLNDFYNGLRVNDRTALRVWFGKHSSYLDLENGEMKNWIRWTEKEGFTLVKGKEIHRKDMFTVGETVEGRQDLLKLSPFYEKDIKTKDAITLEALYAMLGKAAERMTKQADEEGLKLDADTLNLTTSIKNLTSKRIAELKVVTE